MKKIATLVSILLLLTVTSRAQQYRAYLNETGIVQVDTLDNPYAPTSLSDRQNFEQLAGFPLAFPASPTFKNFRNISLADVNADEIDEILLASHHHLYACTATGVLWQKTLSGVAIFPPSIADLDGDGTDEMVQLTGGVPDAGRVYVLDLEGNDLPGWPKSYDDHWMLSAAALADLNGDGQKEIIVAERDPPAGRVHVLRLDGSSYGGQWPIDLDNTPAVTPSVGDIDNDGAMDIVICSSRSIYAFEESGDIKAGFPVSNPATWFSFQSPLLVDLDEDEDLEIVGAAHGDLPEYYVVEHTGAYANGWPIIVPDSSWTFHPPTVVELRGAYHIFNARPIGLDVEDMLYAHGPDASLIDNFPIAKSGGLEGLLTVADVDTDTDFELVFGSNLLGADGRGYIHAYDMNGAMLPDFPIRPRGWTFMNGASLGDVNSDGQMDLIALSYTQNFGASPDSVFLNVYELNVPYNPNKLLWNTYKGSNDRTGFIQEGIMTAMVSPSASSAPAVQLFPNPAVGELRVVLEIQQAEDYQLRIRDRQGRLVQILHEGYLEAGQHDFSVRQAAGWYWLDVTSASYHSQKSFILLSEK